LYLQTLLADELVGTGDGMGLFSSVVFANSISNPYHQLYIFSSVLTSEGAPVNGFVFSQAESTTARKPEQLVSSTISSGNRLWWFITAHMALQRLQDISEF
jgi:hypothetical protein